ncbi:protoporphyrinogen oxidase [Microaerobacter geothermalis]|uniref:protoporphyrinogen oxidase n=1 Tax=Microaerobacter geothermalis TaxID=674972 RepID=UPI001F1EA630|nr:protoporphyrinogen oxidase [Microaerobacter geothermalis]MCF6092470.1 protoporphyrinogen oxidase [Microaerobacter geothermalis]
METKHVAIVGGGIAGLSAAFYLKKSAREKGLNISLKVIEKENHFGGKIKTSYAEGLIIEGGPDSFLARKTAAIQLCEDLGIAEQLVGTNPAAKKNYILHRGRLRSFPPVSVMGIPAKLSSFAKTPLISPIGKIRAGLDLFLPKGNTKEDESLGKFLRRRLGNEVVERIVEPVLAGIYAGSVDELSLKATFPHFHAMIEKYGSLIKGSAAQIAMGKSKKPGQTNTTSAKPGQRKLPSSIFLSLEKGLQTLPEALVDRLNGDDVTLRKGTGVEGLHLSQENKKYQLLLTTGETIFCDAVILATPNFVTTRLLQFDEVLGENLEIPYVSVATVALAYRKSDIQYPLDGSGFVVPRGENRLITACTWVSSKWLHTSTPDQVLLRCYVGRAGDERHLKMTEEEIIEGVQKDLKDIMGIAASPVHAEIFEWKSAMPQYTVGHLERMKKVEDRLSEAYPGLFLTGAGYDGLGVPDCIRQGVSTADNVTQYLKRT